MVAGRKCYVSTGSCANGSIQMAPKGLIQQFLANHAHYRRQSPWHPAYPAQG